MGALPNFPRFNLGASRLKIQTSHAKTKRVKEDPKPRGNNTRCNEWENKEAMAMHGLANDTKHLIFVCMYVSFYHIKNSQVMIVHINIDTVQSINM